MLQFKAVNTEKTSSVCVFDCSSSHLKSSSLQQADLVILREVTEAWDLFGKVHHLLHSWGEAHGELLPDLLAWFAGVHVW